MNRTDNKIYGVILAAGRGDRIKPLSFETPKPLLPVCNKPVMQYQIETMVNLGIKKFIIVVGYLKEKIKEYFGDGSSLGVEICYVEQKENLGIAHAVGQLEGYIDKPFLLFLGDIFIVPRNFKQILDIFYQKKAGAVLAITKMRDLYSVQKNFTVILHGKTNKVRRVIEKPRYLTTGFKGCGIYLFDLSIFDAIRNTPRTAMRDEYEITTSIQILIEDNCPVYAADVVEWDMNVTVPCDLLRCNLKWLKHIGQKEMIHPNVKLHNRAKVINSVICKDVTVNHPITIRNTVIIEGTKVKAEDNIVNSLVSPNHIVLCDGLKVN